METSHKETCWGLVLVIGTKSLADLSLASVAQGRIISRKGGYARAEELIKTASSRANRKSNGQINTNRWTQGALRKQERKTNKLRRGKDKDLQRTQRTGKRWTDTENRQAVDRHREQAGGGQTQRTGEQWTHREQASGGQTQRTGKRFTDTQIAGHTDRKKITEEQIDKNKQAMSRADRGRGNQLNNHSHN